MKKETKVMIAEFLKLFAAALIAGGLCVCSQGCSTSDFSLRAGEWKFGSCDLRATPTSVETFDKSE